MSRKTFEQEIISEEIKKLISDVDRFIVKKDNLKHDITTMWRKNFLELSTNN